MSKEVTNVGITKINSQFHMILDFDDGTTMAGDYDSFDEAVEWLNTMPHAGLEIDEEPTEQNENSEDEGESDQKEV